MRNETNANADATDKYKSAYAHQGNPIRNRRQMRDVYLVHLMQLKYQSR